MVSYRTWWAAHSSYSTGGQQLSGVLCDNTPSFCSGKAIHTGDPLRGMSGVLHRRPCSRLTNYSRRGYFGLSGIYTRPPLLSEFELSGVTDDSLWRGWSADRWWCWKITCGNINAEHQQKVGNGSIFGLYQIYSWRNWSILWRKQFQKDYLTFKTE